MPTAVPIEVFSIARTAVDQDEVKRWMKFINANEFEIPDGEIVSNPALLIALAGKRCYMSFQPGLNPNVTKIRKDYVEYFDNILKSGHGSVLEHSSYSFAIENISRVFTAEMNRHRAGWAISEGSLRFIRFGDNIPFWMPDSIKGPNVYDSMEAHDIVSNIKCRQAGTSTEPIPDPHTMTLEQRKNLSREVFMSAFAGQESYYSALEFIWGPELAEGSKFAGKKQVTSMMRRIIGLGVATGGVWTGNVRALRHVFTMRASEQAEEEMLHVFSRVAKVMAEKEPLIFGDFVETPEGYWKPKYVKV